MPDTQTKSSKRDEFLAFLKTNMEQVFMLTTPKILVDLTGDPVLALMLSQLMYWSDRTKRKDGFIYKSSLDWQKEMGVTDHAVRKFNKLPYIETRLFLANGRPTTHYRLRYDLLKNAISALPQLHYLKTQNGFTEFDIPMGNID